MNILITTLFPSTKDVEKATQTKAIYNLVNDEEMLVLYPVILPVTFKRIFHHIKEPYFKINNIRVLKVPVIKIPKVEIYVTFLLKLILILINKQIGIDNIVFHRVNIVLKLGKFLEKFKLKYQIVVHASDIHLIEKYGEELDKLRLNFRSPSLKIITEEILGEELPYAEISFSGIPSEEILELNRCVQKHNELSTIKIITVGKLIKLKNIDKILVELSKWKETNWEYTIVGTGPEYEKLNKMVKDLGLSEKVIFAGEVKHQNVLEMLKRYHFFILISKPETFGLAYLEAMAKGCIIFCAKNNGVDGFIKNQHSGFSLSDAEYLTQYLDLISTNKNYRINMVKNSIEVIKTLTAENAKENYQKKIIQKGSDWNDSTA